MDKRDELKKQLEELLASEQAQSEARKSVVYPAPFLTINHQTQTWELVDRNTKEKAQLKQEIAVATLQTYLRSIIFTEAGLLKAISQIVLPSERKNMLDIISGERWDELKINETDKLINTWLVPVIITNEHKPALWEIKASALKSVLNFLAENGLKSLSSLVLKMKLIQRKEGTMKKWAEPKIIEFSKLQESEDVKLLEVCVNFYQTFKEFRVKYNMQAINNEEPDIEL